jgi:hypothetical protein
MDHPVAFLNLEFLVMAVNEWTRQQIHEVWLRKHLMHQRQFDYAQRLESLALFS